MKKILIFNLLLLFTLTFSLSVNAELVDEDIRGSFYKTTNNEFLRSSSNVLDAFTIIQRFPQEYLTTWDGQITSWVTEYDDSFFNSIDNFTNGIQISLIDSYGSFNLSHNYQVALLWTFVDTGTNYNFDAELYYTTTTTSQDYLNNWNLINADSISISKGESFIPYVAYDLSFIQEDLEDDANYISVNLGSNIIQFELPPYQGTFDSENTSSSYNFGFKLFDTYTTYITANDILFDVDVDVSIVRDDNINQWYDSVNTSYAQSYGAYKYNQGVEDVINPGFLLNFVSGTVDIMNVEILPNFPLATFVFIPLFFGLLTFFFRLVGKRGVS
jgi:hypothetical protein